MIKVRTLKNGEGFMVIKNEVALPNTLNKQELFVYQAALNAANAEIDKLKEHLQAISDLANRVLP